MKIIITSALVLIVTWIALAFIYDIFFKSLMIVLLFLCIVIIIHITITFVRSGNC